jgi:outer membrane protein TolC
LRARTALALARAETDLAVLDRRAAELRAAAGAATAAELARFATLEARARNAIAAAAFEVEAADRALALALGGPAGEPSGALPEAAELLDGVPEAAWARRSDVLAAQLQVAETDRTADATLRDRLPSLGFSVANTRGDADRTLQWGASFDTRTLQPSASLSYDPDSGVPGVGEDGTSRSWTVGVTLRVPLDPTVGSALAAARIGRERARAQLELAQARAELDVDRRAFELESATADAALAGAAADQARADLAVAEARFASGALSELAIARARLDAERAALDADRALDAARLAALRLLDALAIDPDPAAPAAAPPAAPQE